METTGNNGAIGRVVALAGSRTMREAAETKDTLLAALASGDTVFLDCAAVTEADLSFIQMIIGTAKAASRRGAKLALCSTPAGVLAATLHRGGFAATDDPRDWCKETA